MKTINIGNDLPYSPLIPAMEAIFNADPGEKLELVMEDPAAFGDLKTYLSEKNIGFREIYDEGFLILQFTINR